MKEDNMNNKNNDPDMLDEYDFSTGIKGKYADRFPEGTRFICLDQDVAEYFPDAESVNDALRSLIHIMQNQQKK